MKKVVFIFLAGLTITLIALVILRFQEIYQLETSLLNCNTHPSYCGRSNPTNQTDFEHFDNPQSSQDLFHYLTQEAGFQDIRRSQFQATNNPVLVNPLLQGFSIPDSLRGMQPLFCPQQSCAIFNEGKIIILANDYPIIHMWNITRENAHWGVDGLVISGFEDQKLLVVQYQPEQAFEETFNEGVRAMTASPLNEHELLLEDAISNEANWLWSKQFNYEIACSLFGCKKRYNSLN